MQETYEDQMFIDGLEYCNWNRELLENLWKGGITAVHVTLVSVSYTHLTLPTILLV